MIGFFASSRLACDGFAPYLVTPHPDVGGFVHRAESALVIHMPGSEFIVPESADAQLVALSPGSTLAWVTKRPRKLRRWDRAHGTVTARDDARVGPWSLAVTDGGVVACGGYLWSREHEEHAHAEAVYEMGVPYDYGEIRPEIPPQPPFEPGVAAVWTHDLARVRVKQLSKAVVRVALDPSGALAAWTEDGALELERSRVEWCRGSPSVPAAALVSGGDAAVWTHHTGVYACDPVRGVRRIVAFEPSDVGAAAISLTSHLVAHARREGEIQFFSLDTGALVGEHRMGETVHDVAFAADGRHFAVVTDADVVFGVIADERSAKLPP